MAELKARLIEDLALIEAHIDFPEEEIEPIASWKMRKDLRNHGSPDWTSGSTPTKTERSFVKASPVQSWGRPMSVSRAF